MPGMSRCLSEKRLVSWLIIFTAHNAAFSNCTKAGVLPALEQCFPRYRETFARSSRHAAQAQELLDGVGAEDLARMGGKPAITALQMLPRARQSNVLRHWLRADHATSASAAQLEELLDQVADCTTRGHQIRIKVGTGFVERQGERLAYRAEPA